MKPCSNCGEARRIRAKGLCNTCYAYQHRNGQPRTPEVRRGKRPTGWCKRCGESPAFVETLCRSCHRYMRKNGKHRPYYLFTHKDFCKNCGQPRRDAMHIKGRCHACYMYVRRKGVERPERLWNAEKWCECGQSATHFGVTLPVFTGDGHQRNEYYDLCAGCYAEAEAMR